MSEGKELVWIERDLLPRWDLLQDILRLNGKDLDKVLNSLKEDDKLLEDCLEENLLNIKHHAIQVRNKYKECVDEQIEKTEDLWSLCDNKIIESQTKIKSVENSFDKINKLIDQMNTKLNGLSIYKLNEAMDIIDRFNNMSQKDKDAMELLLGFNNN